jgi:choice-of-anchor B domain-containing protein
MKTLPMAKSTSMLMPTMIYRGPSNATITNSHNIVISEKAGFVYIVGSKTCNGGLHAIDFHDPMNPKYVGCAYDDFYVHDAECVIYNGPDKEHVGREICVTYNGQDGFSVVDVQDKMAPKVLSHTEYDGSAYTHNGGFTMDQSHILLSDELDESRNGHPTRTYLFDLTDLDKPVAMPPYDHKTKCVDHNLYIKGNFAFQANYECGLHILDVSGVGAGGTLKEVAFFDTFPNLDAAEMKGSWTAFPYFKSGAIVMNGTEGGFFVLQPQAEVLGQPK